MGAAMMSIWQTIHSYMTDGLESQTGGPESQTGMAEIIGMGLMVHQALQYQWHMEL